MSLVEKIGWTTLIAILLAASHYFRGPLAELVSLAAVAFRCRSHRNSIVGIGIN